MQMHPSDRHYRDQLIRLTDLAVTDDVIENVTFENCEIVGPAVIILLGGEISGCSFEGDYDAFAWRLDEDRERVIGAIGLVDCHLFGCKITRIGIGVPASQYEAMRAGFSG